MKPDPRQFRNFGMKTPLNALGLLIYGAPAIALAALTLPLYVIVPTFYAEGLSFSVEAIGLTLLFVRLFDAINDPVIGLICDRWRSRFGRRKFWFAVFVPIAMLGAWKLFWPPGDADILYLAFWSVVLSIGYTGTTLPYTAWGAELDTTYHGRATVTAYREGLVLVGTLLAIAVPFTLGWEDPKTFHGLALLAVSIVIALPLFSLLTLSTIPEPFEQSSQRRPLLEGLRSIIANRPFVRLAAAYLFNGLGNAIAATLFLLFVSEYLELEDLRGPFLLLYFFSGIIGIPIWIRLSKTFTKHRTWCMAMIFAIIVFTPAPFLPAGSVIGFSLICILSGLALGADLILPPAIQADVIDVDTASSGEQKSGTYFSLWSLITKSSLALSVGLAFPLLGMIGFSTNNEIPSTHTSILALAFLYGWGPIVFKIPSLFIMWNFPIDQTQVDRLQAQIVEDVKSKPSPNEKGIEI